MTDAQIQIDTIGREEIHVPIIGTSPLIVHRFSEKAKRGRRSSLAMSGSPSSWIWCGLMWRSGERPPAAHRPGHGGWPEHRSDSLYRSGRRGLHSTGECRPSNRSRMNHSGVQPGPATR